jgi:hypothetical protein
MMMMLKALAKLQLSCFICIIYLSSIQSFFTGYKGNANLFYQSQSSFGLQVVTTGPFINSENQPTYIRESSPDLEHLVIIFETLIFIS